MFEQDKTEKRFMAKTVTAKEKIAVKPLRDLVKVSVKDFLGQLDGRQVEDVYELLMVEVELPLLDMVMQHTRGNQTQAAHMLGINRGTLRKKLKKYGLS